MEVEILTVHKAVGQLASSLINQIKFKGKRVMKCTIISQVLLVTFIAVASNSMLFLAADRTSERGGKQVKEMLLSAATCPTTCKDSDGNNCCPA